MICLSKCRIGYNLQILCRLPHGACVWSSVDYFPSVKCLWAHRYEHYLYIVEIHTDINWPGTAAVWPLRRLYKIPRSHFLSPLLLTGTIGSSWELPPGSKKNKQETRSHNILSSFWFKYLHKSSEPRSPTYVEHSGDTVKVLCCWGWFHSPAWSNNILGDKLTANCSWQPVLGQGATDPRVLPMCQIHWWWIIQKTKGQNSEPSLTLITRDHYFHLGFISVQ